VYASVPGGLIVFLDILTTAWFVVAIRETYHSEDDPDKQSFYRFLGFGFSLWFAALPTIVIVASWMDPWVRLKTVTAISMTVTAAAHCAMIGLLWPSRAAKYFRISTPDIMKGADDDL
jgi:GPR180/TMEM145, transmembrane domain